VQPLVVDVELDVPTNSSDRLVETVNYETILKAAQDLAGEGHVDLVETFAHRLAEKCLADPRVSRARVRIEKPLALAPRVRVNGIGPGPTLASIHQDEAAFRAEAESTLLRRAVDPDQIGAALRYLIDASAVTGQMIAVDSGQHLS